MRIVIFDLETTSTVKESADILQVGAIVLNEKFEVVDYINKYVNTPIVNGQRVRVPEDVIAVHGISNEVLEAQAGNYGFEEFWKEYSYLFTECPTLFIAYNADYDTKVLECTCKRYGLVEPEFKMRCDTNFKLPRRRNLVFCPMQYMSHRTGNKWTKLETQLKLSYGDISWLDNSFKEFCSVNNIPVKQDKAHDALFDCFMTLKVLQKECFPNTEAKVDSSIKRVVL